jgi:hypothetical protein
MTSTPKLTAIATTTSAVANSTLSSAQALFSTTAVLAHAQAIRRRQRFISDVHWGTEINVRRLCPYPLDEASPDDLVHGYSLLDMQPRAAVRLERNRLLQLHLERSTLRIASLHDPFTVGKSQALVQQIEASLAQTQAKHQLYSASLQALQELSGLVLREMALTVDQSKLDGNTGKTGHKGLGADSGHALGHGVEPDLTIPLSAQLRQALAQADISTPAQASPVEAMVLIGQRWDALELQITELSLDSLRQSLEIQRLKHFEHIAGFLAKEAADLLANEKTDLSDADPHPAEHDLLACGEAPYLSRWPDPLGLVMANGKLVKPTRRV